jgi:hypothetical protein
MRRVQVGGNRSGMPQAWALVDDEDFEAISAYRWHLHEGYAGRNALIDGCKRIILMHRQILGLVPEDTGRTGDHKNRDRLDNRRENLRIITRAQQRENVSPYGRSGVRGVSFRDGRWRARCRNKHLGSFPTIEEAEAVVRAYRAQHMPFSEEAS